MATGAYNATLTEAVEIATILPIDLHMDRSAAKTFAGIDFTESRGVIDRATLRIRNDARNDAKGKRGRKAKLEKTPLQLERAWLSKTSNASPSLGQVAS